MEKTRLHPLFFYHENRAASNPCLELLALSVRHFQYLGGALNASGPPGKVPGGPKRKLWEAGYYLLNRTVP